MTARPSARGGRARIDIHVARHLGASFRPGWDLVHVEASALSADAVARAWRRHLVTLGVAEDLAFVTEGSRWQAWASCYPFLPLSRVREVVASAAARSADRALARNLADYAYDASAYADAYGLQRANALARGWPAWPLLLGRMPALVLGCGRLHRLVTMNLMPGTSATLALAGIHKGLGRDLMAAYGLPVAPGTVVDTPARAVEQARALGWPVVLKRLVGGNSDGVITDLARPEECEQAARELLRGHGSVLVEKQLRGTELRVHFVGGRIREVIRRGRVEAVGDGRRTLQSMIEAAQPNHLARARRSPQLRRRLAYRFWALGVRRFSDLDGIVPRRGERVLLGLSFEQHTTKSTRLGIRDLDSADRRAIEAFLAHHGGPSGGLDLVVAEPGARLADGGGILEINVPSGFWYVRDPDGIVSEELDRIARDPEFAARWGRVPVWIAPVDRVGAEPPTAVRRHFRATYPGGMVAAPSGSSGWVAVLTRAADALLVPLAEADVAAHGLPRNLAPTVFLQRGQLHLSTTHPVLAETLRHAGPGVEVRAI